MLRVNVDPMGAVRMTQRGKWVNKSAQRYLDYKRVVGWQLRQAVADPEEGPLKVKIIFHMPIPKSWSKRKQQASIGQPHTNKPDIDNLTKGVFDSANGILWNDDKQVVHCEVSKIYGIEPGFEIIVEGA